jgi:hypothetical protein
MNSRQTKREAQDLLMAHVARALGYWPEFLASRGETVENEDEFRIALKVQADRIAKLFGYDEAWAA